MYAKLFKIGNGNNQWQKDKPTVGDTPAKSKPRAASAGSGVFSGLGGGSKSSAPDRVEITDLKAVMGKGVRMTTSAWDKTKQVATKDFVSPADEQKVRAEVHRTLTDGGYKLGAKQKLANGVSAWDYTHSRFPSITARVTPAADDKPASLSMITSNSSVKKIEHEFPTLHGQRQQAFQTALTGY